MARAERKRTQPAPPAKKKKPPGRTQALKGGVPAPLTQYVAVAELEPYARNARIHTPAQVAAIKAAMIRWGYTNPVMADASGIVAGHGRVLAASEIYADGGLLKRPDGTPIPEGTVPVVDVSGWTMDARRAYILADNQLAGLSEVDEVLLKEELDYLNQSDPSLVTGAGFDDVQLAQIMGAWEPDFAKIDETPAAMADMLTLFRIRCKQADADAVRATLERAIKRLALDGLEIIQ